MHTRTRANARTRTRALSATQIWELELDVESKDANNKQVGPVRGRLAEG